MTTAKTPRCGRRRMYTFSLRTFLLTLVICAVLFGRVVNRAEVQRRTVERISELQGPVFYDFQISPNGVYIIDAQPPYPKWLVRLLGIDFFATVKAVDVSRTEISDLTILASLDQLEVLEAWNTKIRSIETVQCWPRLRELGISDTLVTDLTPLKHVPLLNSLALSGTKIDAIDHLSGLKHLRELGLRNTHVSDLSPLDDLPSLAVISLNGSRVTEAEIKRFREHRPNCGYTHDSLDK